MNPTFEAKYIQVIWADQHSALSIKVSDKSLDLLELEPLNYQLDAITYSNACNGNLGQLAFRKLDETNKHPLSFKINSTLSSPLKPIKDSLTGNIWWVEAQKWSPKQKRWESEIFRSAGEVVLSIGKIKCRIHIASSSFSYKELELYLQDFRNDFWYLILHETSYIKGPAKNNKKKLLDSSSVKLIARFIDYTSQIINKPKKALHETQALVPIKNVRPVPRTFMEISTMGRRKMLTSRAYVESYNVPENKYIHYLISRILVLIRGLSEVSKYTANIQQRNLKDYKARLDSFSDYKKIDKQVVLNEVEELTELQVNQKIGLLEAVKSQDHNMNIYPLVSEVINIKLTKKLDNTDSLKFFGEVKVQQAANWSSRTDVLHDGFVYNTSYILMTFSKEFFDGVLIEHAEYEIQGYIRRGFSKDQNQKKLGIFLDYVYIASVSIINCKITSELASTNKKIEELESTNWLRRLTVPEKQLQDKEQISVKKSFDMAHKAHDLSAQLFEELTPYVSKLKSIKRSFIKLNIITDSTLPNSMTFVQNPSYQGAHKLYKEIIELSGFDEHLFIALQEVEKIGIVNISLIYERWCLLQIIKVLIDKYRFLPELNWKDKLIDQTINFKKNIKIDFANGDTGRAITLWYEKELSNLRRPDFILDVTVDNYKDGSATSHRLVMDAKFYEHIDSKRHGGISKVIQDLYQEKDYSEGEKNSVFILHPSKQSVPKKKTPQTWAESSYYGENQLFEWDSSLRNNSHHKYGAVLVSPMIQSSFLDDLQRLIGMFLQYGTENNQNCSEQTMVDGKLFCLVCGSDKYHYYQPPGKSSWWITCGECQHFTAYNYCGNCGNRLIKHGEYWTYHATKALEPTNIKCPSCASLV